MVHRSESPHARVIRRVNLAIRYELPKADMPFRPRGTSRASVPVYPEVCGPRSRSRKAKRNKRRGKKKGAYLVLRVRRACNHLGTARRPSTPSHSASRHSIFFSPRSLARTSSGHYFPGARPPPHALVLFSLFLSLSPLQLGALRAASCRCAYSIIIIGFRSRVACTASLPFRFPSFNYISVPVPSVARCSRIPLR